MPRLVLQTGAADCMPLVGHTNWVYSVVYSPNGRHIVSGSYDTAARVRDAFSEVLIKPSSINPIRVGFGAKPDLDG